MANILIVDSYPAVSSLYCEVLEESGHHVHPATSGREALLVAVHKTIDIAIVDDRLPDFSANEVLIRLKQLQPHVRGILTVTSIFGAPYDAERWHGLVAKSADYTLLEAEVGRLAVNSSRPSQISSGTQHYTHPTAPTLGSEEDASSAETTTSESPRGNRNLKKSSTLTAITEKKG